MGLETAHPEALRQLHKGFSLDQFSRAADRVLQLGAALRVFLLVGVPFIAQAEQSQWIARSVAARVRLRRIGRVAHPDALRQRRARGARPGAGFSSLRRWRISSARSKAPLDAAAASPGRVFADIWDLQAFATCPACFERAGSGSARMNLEQRVLPAASCAAVIPRPAWHEHTGSPPSCADVAIVGSGFAGSLTALALRGSGARWCCSSAGVIRGSPSASPPRRWPTCCSRSCAIGTS